MRNQVQKLERAVTRHQTQAMGLGGYNQTDAYGTHVYVPAPQAVEMVPLIAKHHGSDTYPARNGGCQIYPGKVILPGTHFTDDSCTNSLINGATEDECFLWNLAGQKFIPEDTVLLGYPIDADTSSHKRHFLVYWTSGGTATVITGSLASTLATSDANFTTTSISATISDDGNDPTAGGTITITILNPVSNVSGGHRYHGVAGADWTAIRISATSYLLIDMDCP